MPCGRGGMMNLNFKHWGVLACLLGLVGMSLSAKVERTTVYIFGFSASFTDSVAYITDVQQLDSAYIETKYDFLMDRVVYSDQLQTYLEAVKQMPNSTCTVFFHTKKNKLMEEYNKIRKRYSGDESVMLKELTDGGFKFQSPVYEPPVKVTPEPVESKAAKKENTACRTGVINLKSAMKRRPCVAICRLTPIFRIVRLLWWQRAKLGVGSG